MNTERERHIEEAWMRYQDTLKNLEERKRAVFAREVSSHEANRLTQLRQKLGLA